MVQLCGGRAPSAKLSELSAPSSYSCPPRAPISIPLNPRGTQDEVVFSKVKHVLRKAKARSFMDISDRITDILTDFSPSECQNYFLNAGYGSDYSQSALAPKVCKIKYKFFGNVTIFSICCLLDRLKFLVEIGLRQAKFVAQENPIVVGF
jgi:hypothetical protein